MGSRRKKKKSRRSKSSKTSETKVSRSKKKKDRKKKIVRKKSALEKGWIQVRNGIRTNIKKEKMERIAYVNQFEFSDDESDDEMQEFNADLVERMHYRKLKD